MGQLVGFDPDRLSCLERIDRDHFWFVGRRALIERLVDAYVTPDATVLDVGSGTGRATADLARTGRRIVGIDLLAGALPRISRAGGLPRAVVRGGAEWLPLRDSSFDAVVLLDLLEHTDDEVTLAEARRVLRPQGRMVITVPAVPWLWSYRDEAAGHRRRYTRSGLSKLIEGSELRVEHLRYFNSLTFPLVLATRLLGGGRRSRDAEDRPPRLLNSVLTRVALLEARLHGRIPAPIGSSLVAVARKGA